MGVGAASTCMLSSYKSSRSLSHLLMSSCKPTSSKPLLTRSGF